MSVNESANRMTYCLNRRTTFIAGLSPGRRPNRQNLKMTVAAALASCALMAPVLATAQEANLSTTVAPVGSGTATSRIDIATVTPRPATDRGLALPSLAVTDDGTGPRVSSIALELPDLDLGAVSVASRVGDQPLPAVFRGSALSGAGLASPIRGLTFTTRNSAPLSVSVWQVPTPGMEATGSAAVAAAAVTFNSNSRLSVTPQVVVPNRSSNAQPSVGTAIRANVVGSLALATDVGVTGAADTAWAPLASARLLGQWPRAGVETSVLRGAAVPGAAGTALVSSRDREASQAQVQPLPGLTLAALTSASRPAADPDADETTVGSLRIAYDGLSAGRVAAVRQREATASRASEITSLEWRQRGSGRMAVRYVHQRTSDSALDGGRQGSSRLEVDLPAMAPRSAGRLDLRAALTAGASSQPDRGVNSRVSGRVHLIDDAALTGETEVGLSGADGRVLRALRLTTDMPVVPRTRLQLSYAYRNGASFPLGQVFEARILRRVSLGW